MALLLHTPYARRAVPTGGLVLEARRLFDPGVAWEMDMYMYMY